MKVGDKVLNDRRGHRRNAGMSILLVVRETPKRWVTKNEQYNFEEQWTKDDLQLVGTKSDVWAESSYIEELTSEAQSKFDAWREEENCRVRWAKIKELPFPKHITWSRLKEIYAELETPE